MKKTVNFCDFVDSFRKVRPENFTYQGLRALFDYLEEYEDELGEEIELDVIEICCDYSEYGSFEELQADYKYIESIEDLYEYTSFIEFNGGIIIQQF